jgi:predicted O-linked N-acetylglucosamine transferase (SPINDLY family)
MKQYEPTVAEMFSAAFAVHQRGQFAEAAARYEEILRRQPGHADALYLRGLIAMEGNDLELARHYVGTALAAQPNHPQLLNALGETLRRMGEVVAAEDLLRRALEQAPDHADALNNLGVLLSESGRVAEGIALFKTILRTRPEDLRAMFNLGLAYKRSGDLAAAIECYRRVRDIRPDWPEAGNGLGLALKNSGRIAEAREAFEDLFARTANRDAASNLLLTLCYDPTLAPRQILAMHRRIAGALHPSSAAMPLPPERPPLPERPRVGLISGDFRNHAMRFFIEPLVRGLRDMGIEAVAYCNFDREDAITAQLKSLFADFIHVELMSDEALDARIRADGIDVLLDLSGHSANNRLGVFMRRPAPLQLSWIGFALTTGLDCFDARLTDEITLPPAMAAEFSEPLAYLPGCQWCYAPPAERPPVDDSRSEVFVFGGMHTPAKINHGVLLAWARILRATTPARLRLMGDGTDALLLRLAELVPDGAELATRIDCRKSGSPDDFLEAHRGVDLTLDAFPCNGGTTSFESLWMGVPVLTLAYDHCAGRGGASILARIGADDLVCTTQDDYVERAVAIAQGRCPAPVRGAALRARLMGSSLVDARGYAVGFMDTVRAVGAAARSKPAPSSMGPAPGAVR